MKATLIALRTARDKMRIGMRESEARQLVEAELAAEGLKDAFALTLFGGELSTLDIVMFPTHIT